MKSVAESLGLSKPNVFVGDTQNGFITIKRENADGSISIVSLKPFEAFQAASFMLELGAVKDAKERYFANREQQKESESLPESSNPSKQIKRTSKKATRPAKE